MFSNVFFMILEVRGLWKSIKMGPKSIKNGSEIDAKMMMGSKMAFWMHLGHLGGHLGSQKGGWLFPRNEQDSEPTRWGGEGEG